MPLPNDPHPDPNDRHPHDVHTSGISATGRNEPSPGYETSDIKVTGIVVFLVSLAIFLVIFFVFCFGMGKVINNALIKHDGPVNRWNRAANAPATSKPRNLESNAAMEQQELANMTKRFPTPRLQMDDGNQDLADLHAREDLLLDHYTWINQSQGELRIPIGRAMQVIAQRGLPVVANSEAQQVMVADKNQVMTLPLTNGFARTGYEQLLEIEQARRQERQQPPRNGEQASLRGSH